MNKKALLLLSTALFFFFTVFGQVVQVWPKNPTQFNTITIEFDENQGNKALTKMGNEQVFAHTGVITTASTSDTD